MFHENTEGFGKDLGLMHQVVMLSRKHQVGQKFWGFLAHNDAFFKKVIEMATEEAKLKREDVDGVLNFVTEMRSRECMISEEESYYARSSHSAHHDLIRALMKGFKKLITRAQYSPAAVELCVELEKFFQMAYVRSAVYCQINDHPKDRNRWFHEPIYGLHTTFMDLLAGDGRVYMGSFLDYEAFANDKHIKAFADLWKPISEEWDRACEAEKGSDLGLTKQQLNKLLTGLDQCLNGILGTIRNTINRLT